VIRDVTSSYSADENACDICKGRGFVTLDVYPGHPSFGKALRCPKCGGNKRRQMLVSACGLPDKLKLWTFDKIVRHAGNAAAYDAARERAQQPREFLTLTGPTGVGKSILIASVANLALALGHSALYITTADLLDYIRATFQPGVEGGYEARWELLKSVKVLCLDEMDQFNASPWALEKFFQLINSRYDYGLDRLTCFATNASIDTFPPNLQSRMRDRQCCLFELTGMDVRLCAR
jgi:DNA replication protein DnaC